MAEIGTPYLRFSAKPHVQRAVASGKYTDLQLRRRLRAALRESCMLLRDYAKSHHYFESHSGALERGIRFDIHDGTRSKDVMRWQGKVGYIDKSERERLFYADYQRFGTGLYGIHHQLIRPKYAKFLKFMGKRTGYKGRWFTLRASRGIKGDDYIANAFYKNKAKIDLIFWQALP